jgi:hypothetical protein
MGASVDNRTDARLTQRVPAMRRVMSASVVVSPLGETTDATDARGFFHCRCSQRKLLAQTDAIAIGRSTRRSQRRSMKMRSRRTGEQPTGGTDTVAAGPVPAALSNASDTLK